MAKKWIVTEDERFIMGNVEFHSELLPYKNEVSSMRSLMSFRQPQKMEREKKCLGGGYWHINKENNSAYLYSKSQDFGYCPKEVLVRALSETYNQLSERGFKIYYSQQELLDNAVAEGELLHIDY